ncbi:MULTISPECIES: hypothetical protein [Nocardia]|uniref:Secreted protein n=1 Tax=Nocardia coubleae TaxID=356147 RepID=A0A846W6S3_9NOCA|nr:MULTISPECIES: hypothetical protein [Nocardia]MCA2209405.1 hypothetical protein [Nocardia rosealba]NKX89039.1 hypothetical protein [Nocardia coubleae]
MWKYTGRATLVAAATAGLLLGATTPASAMTPFKPTYTLATGWTCAGQIDATALSGQGITRSGEAEMRLRGTFWSATPGSHQSGCTVTTTVEWRNLDTGAGGSAATVVAGGPSGQPGPEVGLTLATGAGRIEATIRTTPLAHLPSTGEFAVSEF